MVSLSVRSLGSRPPPLGSSFGLKTVNARSCICFHWFDDDASVSWLHVSLVYHLFMTAKKFSLASFEKLG